MKQQFNNLKNVYLNRDKDDKLMIQLEQHYGN